MGEPYGRQGAQSIAFVGGQVYNRTPLLVDSGELAFIPVTDNGDRPVVFLDPTAPAPLRESMFGETSLAPFQSEPTVNSANVSAVVHSPATNEVYVVWYGQAPNTGFGAFTLAHFYFEVHIYDFTTETVTMGDLGVASRHPVLTDWSTLFRSMDYGLSFRGIVGGDLFLGRIDNSSTGTNYDCVVIDTAAHTAAVLDNVYADGTEFSLVEGQVAADGDLYSLASSYALVIDAAGPTFTTSTLGGLLPAGYTWGGLGKDSVARLYGVPSWNVAGGTGELLVVDTVGGHSLTDLGLASIESLCRPSQGSDGLMYMAPTSPTANIDVADGKVVRFDPDTLVAEVFYDFGTDMWSGWGDTGDIVMTGTWGFQVESNTVFLWGFRELVGGTAVTPDPRAAEDVGDVGIVVNLFRPLRALPFLLYDTASWDGSWTMPNDGTAGPDFDLNITAFEDDGNWDFSGDVTVFDNALVDEWSTGGPAWGEPYTYMFVTGDSAGQDIDETDANASVNISGISVAQVFVDTSPLEIRVGGDRISATIDTPVADILLTHAVDVLQGGGSIIVDEAWYSGNDDALVTSNNSWDSHTDMDVTPQLVPTFVDVDLGVTILGASFPSLAGTSWPGVRVFAAFRGTPTADDIAAWKATLV